MVFFVAHMSPSIYFNKSVLIHEYRAGGQLNRYFCPINVWTGGEEVEMADYGGRNKGLLKGSRSSVADA